MLQNRINIFTSYLKQSIENIFNKIPKHVFKKKDNKYIHYNITNIIDYNYKRNSITKEIQILCLKNFCITIIHVI